MAFRTRTTETTINCYTLQAGDKVIFKPLADIDKRMENIHYDPKMKKFFDGKTEFTFHKTIGDLFHDEAEFVVSEDRGWAFHPEWVLKVIPASASTSLPSIEGNLGEGVKVIFKKYEDCIDCSPGLVEDLQPFLDGKSIFTISYYDSEEFFMVEEDNDEGWAFCAAWVKEIVMPGTPPKAPMLEQFSFDNLKVGDLVVLKPLAEQSPSGKRKGDPDAPESAYDGKTPVKVIGLEPGKGFLSAMFSGGGYVMLEYPNGYRNIQGIFFSRLQGWYVDGAKKDVTPTAQVKEEEAGIGLMKLAPGKKYRLKSYDQCEVVDELTGARPDMPFGEVVTVRGSIRPMGSGYEFKIDEDKDGTAYWYFDKWLKPLNEAPKKADEEEAPLADAPVIKAGDKVILKHRDTCASTKTARPVRMYMKDADGQTVVTVAVVDTDGDFLIEEDKGRNGFFQMWYSQEWILRKVEKATSDEVAPLTLDDLRGLDGSDIDTLLINRFPNAKAIVLKTLDSDNPYLMFIPVDFLSEDGIWEYEVGNESLGEYWGDYKFYAGDLDTEAEGCGNTELHSYRCKYLDQDEVQDALDTIKSISVKAEVNFDQFVAGVA